MNQTGRAKFSNRHSFSGKIKCGICGQSYVVRTKKRKDGSVYKLWRCLEAVKYGSFQTDGKNHPHGCGGKSVRHEEFLRIMNMVRGDLDDVLKVAVSQLGQCMDAVIAHREAQDNFGELAAKLNSLEKKRLRFIDLYGDGDITKEEFDQMLEINRAEAERYRHCLDENRNLSRPAPSKEDQLKELSRAIDEVAFGQEPDEVFIREITESIVVTERGGIDVFLKNTLRTWRFDG